MVHGINLFGQVLGYLSRTEFQVIVKRHGAERYSKGFSCWSQFVSMLFCQIGQAHSLRETCGGLKSAVGKLSHLGLDEAPKRSTLAYANEHRPWEVYRDAFYDLLNRSQEMVSPQKKFRFKNKLLSLDATVIELCLEVFPWAKFQQTKGAVKLHMLLDHDGYLPAFADLTTGTTHEITVARAMTFPKGSVVVMDRGFFDFQLFGRLCEEEVYFVTRLKECVAYDVCESREIPAGSNVISDEIISLSSQKGKRTCPYPLRRIVVRIPEKQEVLILLTNHLGFAARTISAIYKDRWQIELFFKALKQNLRVKTFVGTSKNALWTQIWTALIAILILKILALRARRTWALSTLVAYLRWSLFTYRDLEAWINDPYDTPETTRSPVQLHLFNRALGQHP